VQHHPTADVRGLKDERDACGVICGLCRHTIAKTGVSIKSESHIDLKQEGEGGRVDRGREERRERKI